MLRFLITTRTGFPAEDLGSFHAYPSRAIGILLLSILRNCTCESPLCGGSGGGVVDNTLDYQSRGRKIDPPLLRSFG